MKKSFLLLMISWLLFVDVAAQKPLYTAPFGVQTYTFRRSIGKDPAKVLDTIKSMGITEIEGGGGGFNIRRSLKNYVMKGASVFHLPVPAMINW